MGLKDKYNEYLRSDKWALKRQQKAQEQNFRCEICDKFLVKGFHIHHKTYKNFGNEKLSDLQFLCEECHINVHCKQKINNTNKNKKVKEQKKCENCYYSQLEIHKNCNPKYVLYCNKNMDLCSGVCRYYRKGAVKKASIQSNKNCKKQKR